MKEKENKSATENILLEQTHGGKISVFARLRGYFLAGILVTAPIGLTFYFTWIFLRFIDESVSNLIPQQYYPETTVPGIGILIAITGFILIGWFAKNFFGRMILRISEYIVDRMPVIRNLYGAIKQILETIMASQSQAFRDVVMLEYPRKGVFSVGFVTGRSKGEVQRVTSDETINVFVPTTPNPTSGYLLFVPKKELYFLDMTVEEGVKLVISGGIITPPDRGAAEDTDAIDSPAKTREGKTLGKKKASPGVRKLKNGTNDR
jgi:uncharacterized membrane protein